MAGIFRTDKNVINLDTLKYILYLIKNKQEKQKAKGSKKKV